MTYAIFDLDGTVIDSSHRHAAKPDGSLDLEKWFENNVPEKIALDTLLPLAYSMKRIYAAGHTVVICTARSWGRQKLANEKFLADHGLKYHALLHRADDCMLPDDQLKVQLLNDYFQSQGYMFPSQAPCVMFDDNHKVIKAMNAIGIHCFDATVINRKEQILLDKKRKAA